jgi:hypothetical protein
MEKEVHSAEASCRVHDLPALKGLVPKEPLLVRVKVARLHLLVGGEEEAACASGWVAHPHGCCGPHHVHDCPDERTRSEVLSRAGLDVLGVLGKQSLVGIALDVSIKRHPLLAVDQVRDEPFQLRRVLDLVLCLAEDDAERAWLLPEFSQGVQVLDFEVITVEAHQRCPVQAVGNDRRPTERSSRLFVGHLQEEQESQLLDIVLVR